MKSIAAIFLLFFLISCDKKAKLESQESHQMDQLIGTWENDSKEGNLSESWERLNDSTINGQTYYTRGNDTLHNETFVVNQTKDDVAYVATIKGENNDKPVTYKLTKSSEKELIFENPDQHYPAKIFYYQVTPDSIVVEISGVVDGVFSSEKYPMKKK